MIIENDDNNSDNNSDTDDNNHNTSDKNENNDNDHNNDDKKLLVDYPQKGPIMLSFDDTFVESKNNSRVSGDLRCHVPHVTTLWCDILTQHRHICFVESSYDWISSYMSICIQNCVRCNWLWCFGNTAIQPAVDSPKKTTDSAPWCFCVLFPIYFH